MPIVAFQKKVRYAGLFALVALSVLTPPATADTFGHYLKVSASVNNALHVESAGGDALNEETGNIPVFKGTYFSRFENGIFVEFSAEQSSATLDYDGYSQFGLRYQTQSEYYLTEVRALLGRKAVRFASYLGVDSSYRERNIQTANATENYPIAGLYEEYNLKNLFIGFEYFVLQGKKKHLKLVTEVSASIDGSMHVAFAGTADPADIELGQSASASVGVEWFYSFADGYGISLEPIYQYTLMTKSDQYPITVGGVEQGRLFRQPTTEIQELRLELGLSRRF